MTDMASEKNPSAPAITKSELVRRIAREQPQLSEQDVEMAVEKILTRMAEALAAGARIEIRGFGTLRLHHRRPRRAINPRTGARVQVGEKFVPHFKPGAGLRDAVRDAGKAEAAGAEAGARGQK